jgi:hypothetical protein
MEESGGRDRFHVSFGPRQCPFTPGGRCYGEECELWVKEVKVKGIGAVEVNRCAGYVLAVEVFALTRQVREILEGREGWKRRHRRESGEKI